MEEQKNDCEVPMRVKPKVPWTILVYLAGDNNLSEDMITTLKGLKAAGDDNDASQVNILAYYDSIYPSVESNSTFLIKKSPLTR